MPRINLLPIDLSPDSSKARLSNILKNITVVGSVLLIVSVLAVMAIFFINYVEIRNLSQSQKQLEKSIGALEKTEQHLVLVKDRLTKIRKILGKETTADLVGDLLSWQESLGMQLDIQEAEILPDKIIVSFKTPNSFELAEALSSMTEKSDYSRIELTSLNFSPEMGYLVELILYKK
jgi:hypothetical protein